MKSNWKKVKLSDICDVRDGTHDSPKRTAEGSFLITSKHIKGGKIDLSSAYKISVKDFDMVNRRSKVDQWDILLSMIGTIGEVCIVKEKPDFAIKNVGLIKTNDEILSLYLYYYLKAPTAQSDIIARLKGTTQQYLSLGEIRSFPISIPQDDRVMRKITKILSSIDDKIELNNKINRNLETQAQAIFKSWFIDFEPFKNGKFIDSELGKIPEGWSIDRLGSVCECVLGGTPSRSHKEYWEGNIPWINSGKTNEFRVISPSEFISDEALKKSATKFLPKKTTILAITGATLGKISLLEIDACANQSVVGILENDYLPYEYIYRYVSHNIEKITSHQTGGAQQHINKDNIKNFHIILPPKFELKRYKMLVEHLYNEITTLVFQSRFLSQLRDTLLPKLMSGEIDVSDIAV